MSLRDSILCLPALAALSLGSASSKEDQSVEGEVILTFKPAVHELQATTALTRHSLGMTQRYRGLSRHKHRVFALVRDGKKRSTAELIRMLQKDPDVEAAEPNYLRQVSALREDDAELAETWGLSNSGQTVNSVAGVRGIDVKYLEAWKLARPPTGEIVVAVIDTGVDVRHPDLEANIWSNPGEIAGNGVDDDNNGYADDVQGYDFARKTPVVTDSGNHGTHVAGTIAASGHNGLGIIGVQPLAKILPLAVSYDGASMSTSAVLEAINYVILLKDRGVNIVAVNASYGGASATTAERRAIETLRDAGIILCAAAGNDGTDNDLVPAYPAAYSTSNIISVAAVTQTGALAGFSNYGVTSVDIAAPGSNIYSAEPAGNNNISRVTVAGTVFAASSIEHSGLTDSKGISGLIYNCGLGDVSEFPAEVKGNIALIQRGTLNFSTKAANALRAGATAAIIYDNTASAVGSGGWTLGAAGAWIPAVHITRNSGQAILAKLVSPVSGTVANYPGPKGGYRFLSGTSMAAPHVSGAVAFAALNFPEDPMPQRMERILQNSTPLTSLAGKVGTGGLLNLLGIVDAGGDGLPDWWEGVYPMAGSDGPSADTDGDGFTNRQEFLSNTDPSVAASRPGFTDFEGGSGSSQNDFLLSFYGAEGVIYQVEWSDALDVGTWYQLGSAVAGDGSTIRVKDEGALSAAKRRFYRLHLTAP